MLRHGNVEAWTCSSFLQEAANNWNIEPAKAGHLPDEVDEGLGKCLSTLDFQEKRQEFLHKKKSRAIPLKG